MIAVYLTEQNSLEKKLQIELNLVVVVVVVIVVKEEG